jgi:formylglycine-generating enzyme required for sulfatase activity
MARVEPEGAPPFCIDRWEAHLVVVHGTAEAPHPHSHRPEEAQRYLARSAPAVFPQAYINRPEASAACEAAGKRLCSLGEWYRACEGSKGTVYPYGPKREKGRCNVSKPHLLTKLYGSDSRGWRYDEHFNNPELDEVPGFLARTGEYSGCVSEDGVFDLVGNLHEWVADSVDSSLPRKLPLRDDIAAKVGKNRGHGIFMGGFFSTTSEHGEGCRFLTPGHEPKYHDYSTGFRCCADGLR